jgi:hypothetical protein
MEADRRVLERQSRSDLEEDVWEVKLNEGMLTNGLGVIQTKS